MSPKPQFHLSPDSDVAGGHRRRRCADPNSSEKSLVHIGDRVGICRRSGMWM